MDWLLTVVCCALIVELVLRLPFGQSIKAVVLNMNKAVPVVRASAVSDHWKEKAMCAYASRTFAASGKLAGLLVVTLAFAMLAVLALNLVSGSFQDFFISWYGLGSCVVIASLYIMARNVIVRE